MGEIDPNALTSEEEADLGGATPAEKPAPSAEAAAATEQQPSAKPTLAEIADDELLADPRVTAHIEALEKRAEARGFQTAQSQIDSDRAATAARAQAQAIHDQMEDLRVNNPGRFAELMANPKVKKAYAEWRQMEDEEALIGAARQATVQSFDAVAAAFRELPHLAKLSQKDWDALAVAAINAPDGKTWAATFLTKERELLEADVTEKIGKKAEADALVKLRAQLRTAGIDESLIEGASAPTGDAAAAAQRVHQMSDDEWDNLSEPERKQLIAATMHK